MKKYIGVKVIKAQPMTKLAYNQLRGWEMPENEEPTEAGYLVEYQDGGKPCHPDYKGYISWSPKDVFEKSYKPTDGLSFGLAIEAMKIGHKVARTGWNGKNMYILLAEEGSFYRVNQLTDAEVGTEPHIVMFTADKKFQPGWLASQADMLSEDWIIIE